jgi:hypothetical protein
MEDRKKWGMRKPRFVVEEDERGLVAKERVFKNGKTVFNQILGFAYSVDEIVEVLNQLGESSDYLYDLIQTKIWYCQGMFRTTGDNKYKIEENALKVLRDEMHDRSSIFIYSDALIKLQEELSK